VKRVIGIALVAAALFWGYRAVADRGATKAYEAFSEAWVHGDAVEAARFGDAATVRHALQERALRGTPGGAAMEAFRGTRYEVESKDRSPEGDVRLEVKQTIFFDPPGVTTGIGGAMATHFHHSATIRKSGDGWTVVAFEPTYLDMGEIRRRAP